MSEYRIDELARAAGMTVRNVRVYQERGLLPPPRKEGRVGLYDDAHLARLRLIGGLLDRGYGFTHIAELIGAWERGRDLSDLLGLEQVLTGPWSDEIPSHMTADELEDMYAGQITDATTKRALELGILEVDGDLTVGPSGRPSGRFRVPSPRILHAGAELVAAGVPLSAVLELAEQLQTDIDHSAGLLVQAVATHIFASHADNWLPAGDELRQLTDLVGRLRPLAQMAVDAYLARAIEQHIRAALGDRFVKLFDDEGEASAS